LWSAYAVSGLPVPATLKQVEQRIEVVSASLRELKADVLATQRSTIGLSRNLLRTERASAVRSTEVTGIDIPARLTFHRRVEEIDDLLRDLETSDAELRTAIAKLRS